MGNAQHTGTLFPLGTALSDRPLLGAGNGLHRYFFHFVVFFFNDRCIFIDDVIIKMKFHIFRMLKTCGVHGMISSHQLVVGIRYFQIFVMNFFSGFISAFGYSFIGDDIIHI